MHSMTGFGQASDENDRFRVRVTLRGVNHRFLDLSMRLDDPSRASESAVRELLASRLGRGRVEVRVVVKSLVEGEARVVFRKDVLDAVRKETAGADLDFGEITFSDLIRLPGIFELSFAATDWTTEDETLLVATAGQALEHFVEARAEEGLRLSSILSEKVEALDEVVTHLVALREEVASSHLDQLEARMKELLDGAGVDPIRLSQEAAFLAERSDVAEELDRLQAHLEQFRELLSDGTAQGKRMDFLTQELLREVNTLGSKARHVEMTRLVLDAKMLCEQLREQLQNVE